MATPHETGDLRLKAADSTFQAYWEDRQEVDGQNYELKTEYKGTWSGEFGLGEPVEFRISYCKVSIVTVLEDGVGDSAHNSPGIEPVVYEDHECQDWLPNILTQFVACSSGAQRDSTKAEEEVLLSLPIHKWPIPDARFDTTNQGLSRVSQCYPTVVLTEQSREPDGDSDDKLKENDGAGNDEPIAEGNDKDETAGDGIGACETAEEPKAEEGTSLPVESPSSASQPERQDPGVLHFAAVGLATVSLILVGVGIGFSTSAETGLVKLELSSSVYGTIGIHQFCFTASGGSNFTCTGVTIPSQCTSGIDVRNRWMGVQVCYLAAGFFQLAMVFTILGNSKAIALARVLISLFGFLSFAALGVFVYLFFQSWIACDGELCSIYTAFTGSCDQTYRWPWWITVGAGGLSLMSFVLSIVAFTSATPDAEKSRAQSTSPGTSANEPMTVNEEEPVEEEGEAPVDSQQAPAEEDEREQGDATEEEASRDLQVAAISGEDTKPVDDETKDNDAGKDNEGAAGETNKGEEREEEEEEEEEDWPMPEGDWVFQEDSDGLYYNEESGYYYHPPSGLFFDWDSGMWYDPNEDVWYDPDSWWGEKEEEEEQEGDGEDNSAEATGDKTA